MFYNFTILPVLFSCDGKCSTTLPYFLSCLVVTVNVLQLYHTSCLVSTMHRWTSSNWRHQLSRPGRWGPEQQKPLGSLLLLFMFHVPYVHCMFVWTHVCVCTYVCTYVCPFPGTCRCSSSRNVTAERLQISAYQTNYKHLPLPLFFCLFLYLCF